MLLIECPWCGPRAETEFGYGGEAGIVRPLDPDALSDAGWADYLFNRTNPQGAHRELWNHAQGCRRWFGVERDTVTYRIERSYKLSGNGAGVAVGGDATNEAGAEPVPQIVTAADAGSGTEADDRPETVVEANPMSSSGAGTGHATGTDAGEGG